MEHNPESVLAIGEVALFIIGFILSLILLGILLIPSLLRFQVPHWVRVRVRPEDRSELWTGLISALQKRGYRLLEVLDHEAIEGAGEERVILTKDQATLYYITLAPVRAIVTGASRSDRNAAKTSASIASPIQAELLSTKALTAVIRFCCFTIVDPAPLMGTISVPSASNHGT